MGRAPLGAPGDPLSVIRPRKPELLEVFDRHRTVRHYTDARIPEGDVALIIQAGRRAPTDATGFMYTVIRITDHDLRQRLSVLAGDQEHIRQASDFFVICVDLLRQRQLVERLGAVPASPGEWAVLFGIVDATIVAQSLAVAAEALGYGTGFVGGIQHDAPQIAKALNLPSGVFPLVGLTMGVIAREPSIRKRLPTEATFNENTYVTLTAQQLDDCMAAMASSSGAFDWPATLTRYFAKGGVMETREATIQRGLRQQGILPPK